MIEIILSLAQAVFSRNNGSGDSPVKSHILKRVLCLIVPSICLYESGVSWNSSVIVLFIMYIAISTGHGRFFTLGRGPYPDREDNWPSFLSRKLSLPRRSWLFDSISLAITGLAFTSPLILVYPTACAVPLIISGVSKPILYELSIRTNLDRTDDFIKEAELLTGFTYGIGITSVLWIPKLL